MAHTPALKIYSVAEHGIVYEHLSSAAREVLETLHKHGFQALVVGGGVRDFMLGQTPKDFDIATDATPEQTRELFRRCRIVGRRFKLAHVHVGREMIEVATFRAQHQEQLGHLGSTNDSGMITRDNIYGSLEEDAMRRDFTMNALYYNVSDRQVYDYTGGMQDIKSRVLRLIGEPELRYREDPVRMLRAVRLSAKLGVSIDAAAGQLIPRLAYLLEGVAAARLFDELMKLLMAGFAESAWNSLQGTGILPVLFPVLSDEIRQAGWVDPMIAIAMANTDARIREAKPVTPAFLLAVLLWPAVKDRADHLQQQMPIYPAMNEAANQVLSEQTKAIAIPRRFTQMMREIWLMQLRLPRRQGKRAEALLAERRFRASYDFLLLREQSEEIVTPAGETSLGQWWTDYQQQDVDGRHQMVRRLGSHAGKKPRRRRRS